MISEERKAMIKEELSRMINTAWLNGEFDLDCSDEEAMYVRSLIDTIIAHLQ